MSKKIKEVFKRMGLNKEYDRITNQDVKINEEIIKTLRENTDKDEVMGEFLFKLIDLELEHPSTKWWHYKDIYNKLIKDNSSKWKE